MRSKVNQFLSFLASGILIFNFLLQFAPYTAQAATEKNVPYIDASGSLQKCTSAITLVGKETSLNSGWYIVRSANTNFQSRLSINGDVHIILSDKCSAAIKGGIKVEEGNSLTIYAQSKYNFEYPYPLGYLYAQETRDGNAAIGGNGGKADSENGGNCGTITINGGNIKAKGSYGQRGGSGIGGGGGYNKGNGGSGGKITINNGKLEVCGSESSRSGGAGIGGGGGNNGGDSGIITINGGNVDATGGSGESQLGPYYGGGAGIGGGGGMEGKGGNGDIITINKGYVTSTGGVGNGGGSGIGGGGGSRGGNGGKITINNNSTTARNHRSGYYGWSTGAGIGGGGGSLGNAGGNGGDITITGGWVTSLSESDSSGGSAIGGGGGSMVDESGKFKSATLGDKGILNLPLAYSYKINMRANASNVDATTYDKNKTGSSPAFPEKEREKFKFIQFTILNSSGIDSQPFEQWLNDVEGYRVGLKAPAGVFAPGSTFHAREIIYDRASDKDEFLKITNDIDLKYKDFYDTVGIYEFYVTDPSGNRYESLNGLATVLIEVEGYLDPNNLTAVRIDKRQDTPLMNLRKSSFGGKDYFVADLDHFSYYALINKYSENKKIWILTAGLSAVLLISAGVFVWINRKKFKKIRV